MDFESILITLIHNDVIMSSLRVTTADGCVHTANATELDC